MSTAAATKTIVPSTIESSILARVLEEGYGPGAWHGADLRAAVSDVSDATAAWRPGEGRHNIAEITLHHAWTVHSVIERLTGRDPGAFVVEGSDWFEVPNQRIGWSEIRSNLEATQQRLVDVVAAIGNGATASPLSPAEQFELLLGVTCHAVYHAGQIQLIKVLPTAG